MASTPTPVCNFGWPAPAFSLPGIDGRAHSLESVRGTNGALVMFICNHCPYVKAVLDSIVRDCCDLAPFGIGAVAIMSNDPADYPEDSWENMIQVARDKEFPFPYLLDRDQSVARAYGAVCTPEFFGFNGRLELQYRGRLDASGREPLENAPRELFEAMRLISQTGRGPVHQIPGIGCSIKWRAA